MTPSFQGCLGMGSLHTVCSVSSLIGTFTGRLDTPGSGLQNSPASRVLTTRNSVSRNSLRSKNDIRVNIKVIVEVDTTPSQSEGG